MALLLGVAFFVMIGGLILAANAINMHSIYTGITSDPAFNRTGFRGMDGPKGFGRGQGNCFSNIEVSEEYTKKVNKILNEDTNVQKLISESYNITSIRPLIKSTVSADETVTSKATTAIVRLENVLSGSVTVKVALN